MAYTLNLTGYLKEQKRICSDKHTKIYFDSLTEPTQ